MRVLVKSTSLDTYQILKRKIKSAGIEFCKENEKWLFMAIKVPQAKSSIFYELLELGGTIERDIKNDLD